MSSTWRQSLTLGLAACGDVDYYTHHPISCGCGCKGVTRIEAELAARAHRIKKLDRNERAFFAATMKSVTQMEREILSGLGLPPLESVRRYVMTGDGDEGRWTAWGIEQEQALDSAVSGHLQRFLGEPWSELKAPKADPLYKYFQLQSMAISADYVESLIEAAPGHPDVVSMIAPDPNYLRFRAMQNAAGTRIRTQVALDSLSEVKRQLEQMARDGEWPIRVAGHLHKEIGEGKAWYWRRITRTESTLAFNLAYDWMAETNNVLYDEWSAGPDACVICLGFDGQIWEHGNGPYPATDTHPHCGCVLLPKYIPGGIIQDSWTRNNPYDEPYTAEEIDAIIERIGNRRKP